MSKQTKPVSIVLIGREHFTQSTYFSVTCIVDGIEKETSTVQNGYGSHYEYVGMRLLAENGHIPPMESDNEASHIYAKRTGINVYTTRIEVPRKRDL